MSLEGKSAVITGASRGIGAAVARMLDDRGCNLGLASRSGDDLGLERVVARPSDVRDLDALVELCDATAERFGGIDIVVANAGVGAYGPFLELSREHLDEMLDVNLKGTVYAIRAALPHMLGGEGDVVTLASEAGRRTWEGLILRAPVVGPLVAQFAMARFCRMLGTLLAAGVPLVQGLNVARKSIGNQILVDAVANSIERVQQGGQLGASLSECRGLFPGSVLEMVSVAEESGKLDQELIRIANVTEGDLDRHLKTAVAFAEPLMLFLIAGFIGTIFISMVLPIFTLQDYIK